MEGLFVKNAFLRSASFDALYALFAEAADALSVTLTVTDNQALARPLDAPLPEADFVLFWDKDVSLAARLQNGGLPVFNTPDSVRVCDSKSETALALAFAGIPTPRTLLAPLTYEDVGYPDTAFVREACRTLGLPLVIKEAYGSFGEQVYLAHTEDEALAITSRIGTRPFLFQEFIADAFGTDIRVNVVGDDAVIAMRRTGKAGDFRSNIANGGCGEPHTLTAAQKEIALAAARAVGAHFAGVDLLLRGDGKPLVCEVNSNPHFVGTYRYTGVNLAKPILAHILKEI